MLKHGIRTESMFCQEKYRYKIPNASNICKKKKKTYILMIVIWRIKPFTKSKKVADLYQSKTWSRSQNTIF